MKEKILALLTAKFAGMRKDGLTQLAGSLALQAQTEEEAQALVEKLDQAKVTEYIKEYRSGVDKEITTATKTAEDKLKEKFDFVEKVAEGASTSKTDEGTGDDLDARLNVLFEQKLKPFTEKIQGYEQKEKETLRNNFITSKAKELGIPDWRIEEGFTITDDADDAAVIEKLTSVKQNIVSAGLERNPGFPIDLNNKPTTEETDAVLDKIGI